MGDSPSPYRRVWMTGPPPYLKVSRSGTSTEINILSINIHPELDMTLRENHTLIERVAYGMEIFRRKKNSDPLHADKKCRLGNDTLMHPRLRWIHDVQLLRLCTFRTSSSRYKWSMPMLRHRILIIPGNPQKTYSLLCLIPKLSLLEPFNVKSLT